MKTTPENSDADVIASRTRTGGESRTSAVSTPPTA